MREDERTVEFVVRPGRSVSDVDLHGDFVAWLTGTPMARNGAGAFVASLQVPVGAYSYKLQSPADGAWFLDAGNPRTRGWEGDRNSLLVVGGTDEPVLHAPAVPWLHRDDGGLLIVRAGLRHGAGGSLRVRVREGSGPPVSWPMHVLFDEDEHVLFEAAVPATASRIEYLFELDDGRHVGAPGGAGQALRVPHTLHRAASPDWWRDAVVYTVFVDRFRPPAGAVAHGRERAGGTLWGVIDGLDHVRDLGATVLHLTPIALSHSAHRYDAVDPRQVDPALGGDEALGRLVEAAHARGLKVLLDVTLTHVHRDFFAFQDVRERGPRSPYWRWFSPLRWPFSEGLGCGYRYYQHKQWEEPLLDHTEPEVGDYLVETFERWAACAVDGFRLDALADIPLETARRIVRAVRARRSDAVLFGEVIPDNSSRWTRAGIDAVTDFPSEEALLDWIARGRADAFRTASRLSRRRLARGGPSCLHVGFDATHDQARVLSVVADPRRARLAHLLVLTGPWVPMVLYGDEVGLRTPEPIEKFEDAWPDRIPMPWEASQWDGATLSLFRDALAVRANSVALRRGDETALALGPDVLCLRRHAGDEVVDVVAHAGEGTVTAAWPAGAGSGVEMLLRLGDVEVSGRGVTLGPWAGVVVRRSLDPEVARAMTEARADNVARATAAFDERHLQTLSLPRRLYLTVTEACNLRCRHCITSAPEWTRTGRARTIAPWVLERLADALSTVEYVGFSHGGESLFAPAFWDVLAALRRARGPAAPRLDVHLLSNGMLLRPDTVARLVEGGVTSLAISLDGADAATNDRIRVGGRFATIVDRLRETVRLRAARGWDLRVGSAPVVGRSNVETLGGLAALSRSIGVDWLKVEETFPVNGFSRHDVLPPDDDRVRRLVGELRAGLAGSSVVLVDHLQPPGGCDCDLSASAALHTFREADDFANRARFRACRMAWEQAAIDPDGTVHPVDYEHPPVGSLLDATLLELWNGPALQELRAAVLQRHDAGLDPRTVLTRPTP